MKNAVFAEEAEAQHDGRKFEEQCASRVRWTSAQKIGDGWRKLRSTD